MTLAETNKKGKPLTVLNSDDGLPVYVVSSGGLFCQISERESGQHWGAFVDSAHEPGNVEKLFRLLAQNVKTSKETCECKIVGIRTAIEQVQALMKSSGFDQIKIIEREIVELFFYSKTGKLKVAVSSSVFQTSTTPAVNTAAMAPAESQEPKAVTGITKKIRVLIIDDSATIQTLLGRIFSSDPEMEVVGKCERPSGAEELINKLKPDVITLDVHMPEMDGVTLLKKYMAVRPTPTVMITSISMEDGPYVLDALEHGAVDYIQKPRMEELKEIGPLIIEKVKAAARARISPKRLPTVNKRIALGEVNTKTLVAIGSSTGGTEALKDVLTRLPEQVPPILIVQHIPPVFSKAFATRMNQICAFEVKEAAHGDEVRAGRALIAPGGFQMSLKAKPDGNLIVEILDTPPVNRHKPSVDVLFNSVADVMGKKSVGIILTGMGADGARGLVKMKEAGARTMAQSEATCVVFGMPKEAIRMGGATVVKDLLDIPEQLLQWLSMTKAA